MESGPQGPLSLAVKAYPPNGKGVRMARKKPIPPKNIALKVREFAEPEVTACGLVLWDVTFEKAGSLYELTLYIDHPDRPISAEDCENVSRRVDPLLDRYDPIEQSYTFYVSSTGHPRTLRTPEHFDWALGREVVVRLYQPLDGAKEYTGILKSHCEDGLTLTLAPDKDLAIEASLIGSVRTPAPDLAELPEFDEEYDGE